MDGAQPLRKARAATCLDAGVQAGLCAHRTTGGSGHQAPHLHRQEYSASRRRLPAAPRGLRRALGRAGPHLQSQRHREQRRRLWRVQVSAPRGAPGAAAAGARAAPGALGACSCCGCVCWVVGRVALGGKGRGSRESMRALLSGRLRVQRRLKRNSQPLCGPIPLWLSLSCSSKLGPPTHVHACAHKRPPTRKLVVAARRAVQPLPKRDRCLERRERRAAQVPRHQVRHQARGARRRRGVGGRPRQRHALCA